MGGREIKRKRQVAVLAVAGAIIFSINLRYDIIINSLNSTARDAKYVGNHNSFFLWQMLFLFLRQSSGVERSEQRPVELSVVGGAEAAQASGTLQ